MIRAHLIGSAIKGGQHAALAQRSASIITLTQVHTNHTLQGKDRESKAVDETHTHKKDASISTRTQRHAGQRSPKVGIREGNHGTHVYVNACLCWILVGLPYLHPQLLA